MYGKYGVKAKRRISNVPQSLIIEIFNDIKLEILKMELLVSGKAEYIFFLSINDYLEKKMYKDIMPLSLFSILSKWLLIRFSDN